MLDLSAGFLIPIFYLSAMQQLKDNILACLQDLKGSGKFASIHTTDFLFPGLEVEGVGEIAYPVNKPQAHALIQVAHQALLAKAARLSLTTM